MSGYLPPGCTQRECDQAQPGYYDEPEADDLEMGLERCPQPCPQCWGDGGWDVPHAVDYRNGDLLTHWSECRHCGGKGDDPESESPPITQDDLDEMAGYADDVYEMAGVVGF